MKSTIDQLVAKTAKNVLKAMPDKKQRSFFFREILKSHSTSISQSQFYLWVAIREEANKLKNYAKRRKSINPRRVL